MRRICAWCGTSLDGGGHASDAPITHGICLECVERFFARSGRSLEDLLDRLDAPVLLVDASGAVRAANERARTLLGKSTEEIAGHPGGDVFECAYARLPGGCGRTEHCKACTIRNTVMETHATGMARVRVSAYQDIRGPRGTKRARFLLSTEKKGRVVLLRIDEVGPGEPVSSL